MFAVTLSREEMATAVAGMQFWAQEMEKYAAMTEGAIAEANNAEYKQRMSATESMK